MGPPPVFGYSTIVETAPNSRHSDSEALVGHWAVSPTSTICLRLLRSFEALTRNFKNHGPVTMSNTLGQGNDMIVDESPDDPRRTHDDHDKDGQSVSDTKEKCVY